MQYSDLCKESGGSFIYHRPTQVGEGAEERYRLRYALTLCRYADLFGVPPDPQFWPKSHRDTCGSLDSPLALCWMVTAVCVTLFFFILWTVSGFDNGVPGWGAFGVYVLRGCIFGLDVKTIEPVMLFSERPSDPECSCYSPFP